MTITAFSGHNIHRYLKNTQPIASRCFDSLKADAKGEAYFRENFDSFLPWGH
jgi:hypothetical protein